MAERTLSSIPFLSSPIDANRKSSNSGSRREAEAERVISTTECHYLYRTHGSDNEVQGRRRRLCRNRTILRVGATWEARKLRRSGPRELGICRCTALAGARRSIRRLMPTGLRLTAGVITCAKSSFFQDLSAHPCDRCKPRPVARKSGGIRCYTRQRWRNDCQNFRIGEGDLLERERGQAIALTSSSAG